MSDQPKSPGMNEDPFAANPYAPTSNVSDAQLATDDVEAYRRQYLSHEASAQSIGLLYLLGAIFMVPIGLVVIVAAFADPGAMGNGTPIFVVMAGLFYLALGVLQGFVGVGLRRLQGWARVVAVVFSVLGLIAIPIGTLISAYFLYVLLSEKGQIVFSENYKRVIEQTPHIKYKTSIIVWIFLGLLVAVIGLGIVGLLFAGAN